MTLCFVHARFSWNNRKNVCRIFIYFFVDPSYIIYLLAYYIYHRMKKKELFEKFYFFFALVFLNVSWISIDHITYKNIIAWAKVYCSMKIKKREKMSIINVIMQNLSRKCLVALLRVFVVFLIFFLWFKGNSSNILDAGLFLLYFFGHFLCFFSHLKLLN